MNRILQCLLITLLTLAFPATSMGVHIEGEETIVAMVACQIKAQAPYRIEVVSSSVNATINPIPTISRGHSCSQTLHELLTSEFQISETSLENVIFVFVLTRVDHSTQKH